MGPEAFRKWAVPGLRAQLGKIHSAPPGGGGWCPLAQLWVQEEGLPCRSKAGSFQMLFTLHLPHRKELHFIFCSTGHGTYSCAYAEHALHH